MNIYHQWIAIGACLILVAIMIIFRKTAWVQKTWKIFAVIVPPILGIILVALRNKATPVQPTPKPDPVPVPIPVVGTTTAAPVIQPVTIVVGLDYQLSKHFNFGALTKTENREYIDKNRELAKEFLKNMGALCNNVLEPVWGLMGPFTINSCFRCPELNLKIGGSSTSQHMHAEAADTEYAGRTLHQAFNDIAFSSIKFSQIILEFNQWIHIGVIDEVLHPGKIGQRFIATREVYKIGDKDYDPKNPNKTHVVYTSVSRPI